MKNKLAVVLAAAVLVALAGCSKAQAPTAKPLSVKPTLTTTYCTDDGVVLKMDLYLPALAPLSGSPVVLFAHGGAWILGNRFGDPYLAALVPRLNSQGIAIASVDYRLGRAGRFPAQVVDLACAVRYLRAEAGHFKLNSDLIGAVGSSAGGHLVSLLALETAGDDWNVGQYAGESSQIQAVVDLFGPTDLDSPDLAKLLGPEIDTVFGAEPGSGSPLLTQSSPADIVRDGAPPFLIVQGTNDILVPKQQATELEERLRADHDSVDLLLVRGGQHGLTTPGESPDHVEIINEIVGFLESKLPSPLPPPPMPPVPNGSATK